MRHALLSLALLGLASSPATDLDVRWFVLPTMRSAAPADSPLFNSIPPPPARLRQAPPATDIYELVFDGSLDGLSSTKRQVVSAEPGYDNQPFFTPDGRSILFTANRDGKQTDIYELTRATRRVARLTTTAEGEYSPTPTPDGGGFSVIRVEADGRQRLWKFDRSGQRPEVVLTDIAPVGYHAWIDADQLALFVLGKPATLQHARVSTGKAAVIAHDIGRSLHKIPGTNMVSFIHRETPKEVWVKQFDPASGAVTRLVRAVAGPGDRDVAWMPDGTLLMSSATKIFAWRRGDADWREVLDVAGWKLGAVTRMAFAPDGRALAIVVNEGE